MRKFSWLGLALTLVFSAACGDDSAPSDAGDARADAAPDGSAPLTGLVGSACVEDADCLAGLSCFEGPDGARPWPGGYCTRDCSSAGDCPGGSVCGIAYDDGTASYDLCQAICSREEGSRGSCREGYQCARQGYCTIGCSSDDQCHTNDTYPGPPSYEPSASCELSSGRCLHGTVPTAQDGDACGSNADCRPPAGFCVLGVCVNANCDLGGAYACGTGQQCIGWSTGFDSWVSVCANSCRQGVDGLGGVSADDRCAFGFWCAPPEADPSGRATQPYCGLKAVGVGGSTTATMGSPCTTEADCPLALGYGICAAGTCSAAYCAAPSLADQDICGPGAVCFAPEADRANLGWRSVPPSLGQCVRDCSSDASVCEAPTTCSATGTCLSGSL
ncbi:MAG: hypothetical protein GXP55_11815 [Deltaproteobacteria bacterium]|nr:hypothetical protein [Deltaproteobacteria bacterium]